MTNNKKGGVSVEIGAHEIHQVSDPTNVGFDLALGEDGGLAIENSDLKTLLDWMLQSSISPRLQAWYMESVGRSDSRFIYFRIIDLIKMTPHSFFG